MKKKSLNVLIIIILSILTQSCLFMFARFIEGTSTLIGSQIDSKIPFNVYAIIPYTIWYILIFLIPILFYKSNKETYKKYILSYLLISIIADIIFMLFPTTVARPEIINNGFLYSITKIIFNIDSPPVNCFPSLHTAISFVWILFATKEKNINNIYKILIYIFSISIILSTLFIKQHVLIDVIGGIALSTIIYIIVDKCKKLTKLTHFIDKYI